MVETLHQPFPMLPGRRAQVWRHQPAFRRPRHFHAEPEINMVFRGSALMGVGSREILLGPGELIFIKPAQDHIMLEASDDLELLVLAAEPELAERFSASAYPVEPCKLRADEGRAAKLWDELVHLGDLSDPHTHEASVARLFEWALPQHPRGHVTARRALEVLLRDPSVPATELARALGSAPAELSRHFSDQLGVRFVEARARVRLMRFIAQVDAGSSVTSAALAHFGSYPHCHRVFTRHLGCSPRAFFHGERQLVAAATFRA